MVVKSTIFFDICVPFINVLALVGHEVVHKKLTVTRQYENELNVKVMKETPESIRSRAVMDLLDEYKPAQAGFEAWKHAENTIQKEVKEMHEYAPK